MSQTYDIAMTEGQRTLLLTVVDGADTQEGIKGARRQGRAATALESYKLKNPPAAQEGRIPISAPVVVRLTHENVEVIIESVERACRPTIVQGQEVRPAILKVAGMRILDTVIETLQRVIKGEAAELEDVEVVGLNGSGAVPAVDTE